MPLRAGSSTIREILAFDDIGTLVQGQIVAEELTETEAGAADAQDVIAILENLGLVVVVPDPE